MISFLILLFSYIPNFLVYGLLILSILVLLTYKVLPIYAITKNKIKIAAIGVFIISLYASGMIVVINEYKAKVKEFEIELALAEEKSKQINEKIKYVYVDKRVKIQEKSKQTQSNIDRQKDSINKSCVITPNIVELHNQGVRREK